MSLAMVEELRQALAQAEASVGSAQPTRVVVLRGAGGHFCAGGDLKDMAMARMRAMEAPAGTDPVAEVNAAFGRMCAAYADTPLAVVAVLEGTVMGGGLGLACVADVAIATRRRASACPRPRWAWCPRRSHPSSSSAWATRRPSAWP
jgi:isohexenylglutaconyl-CoA hydratase